MLQWSSEDYDESEKGKAQAQSLAFFQMIESVLTGEVQILINRNLSSNVADPDPLEFSVHHGSRSGVVGENSGEINLKSSNFYRSSSVPDPDLDPTGSEMIWSRGSGYVLPLFHTNL